MPGYVMTRIARTLSAIGRETWRNPITFFLVWVPSLTVLILSVNPSLTADLAPLQRISFWLLHVSLLLPLLMIAQNVIDEMLAALCLSPVILVTLTAICASVAFAPVSMLLDLLFSPPGSVFGTNPYPAADRRDHCFGAADALCLASCQWRAPDDAVGAPDSARVIGGERTVDGAGHT